MDCYLLKACLYSDSLGWFRWSVCKHIFAQFGLHLARFPLSSLPFHLFIGVSVVVVPVPLSLLAFLTPPCWVWIGWSRIPQQRRKLFNIERERALWCASQRIIPGLYFTPYFNSALVCWMLAFNVIFWPFTTIGLYIHLLFQFLRHTLEPHTRSQGLGLAAYFPLSILRCPIPNLVCKCVVCHFRLLHESFGVRQNESFSLRPSFSCGSGARNRNAFQFVAGQPRLPSLLPCPAPSRHPVKLWARRRV